MNISRIFAPVTLAASAISSALIRPAMNAATKLFSNASTLTKLAQNNVKMTQSLGISTSVLARSLGTTGTMKPMPKTTPSAQLPKAPGFFSNVLSKTQSFFSKAAKPLPQPVVNFAAAFGDTLSFGLTQGVRKLQGTQHVVEKNSKSYTYGERAATGFSLFFGGAHLGRNAVYQMGKTGTIGKGIGRIFSDNRSWNTVRDMWSKAAGNGQRWLKSAGVDLHHWLVPQRAGKLNASFNYLPISSKLNQWMNGSTPARKLVEGGFRATVLGIYGAPVTSGVNTANQALKR
jgi:hypothetical protein